MDIGKSFSYVFDDEKWVTKVLIGGVVNLIPIVNLAAAGYGVRVLQNVAAGEQRPLPEWGDFGTFFVKGLLVAVAGLIYAIPLILLGALMAIVGAIGGASADAVRSSSSASGILGLCVLGLSCLAGIYGLLMALWLPAATAKYARSGQFASFFAFGEVWGFIMANLGGYVTALLVTVLAAIAASVVGGILCLVGTVFTSFWAMLVYAHLFGQIAGPGAITPAPAPAGTM